MTHHMHMCCNLKKGQSIICEQCGFELEVINECSQDCDGQNCCNASDLVCCGKPMKFKA
jgi:hypothetical protein